MTTTIIIEGANARGLVEYAAQHYSNIQQLRITIGESNGRGYARLSFNGGANSVPAYGTVSHEELATDPVARLRELNAQYARGELTENPVQALREIMGLLDPAYEQLLRS